MSKTKRMRYSAAFKSKVGLEALRGVKAVWATNIGLFLRGLYDLYPNLRDEV